MSFAYDESLSDAVSRVRSVLGDVTDPGYLPDETYQAVLKANVRDETATIRAMAGRLAAWAAGKPSSLSSAAGSLSWGERVAFWRGLANGTIPINGQRTLSGGALTLNFQDDGS